MSILAKEIKTPLGGKQDASSAKLNHTRGLALYLIAATLIIVDIGHTFLTQSAAPGMTPARMAGLFALGVFCLCPLIFAITKRLIFASILLLTATLFVILYTSFKNGGAPAPTMPFLVIMPLAATILVNRVAGIVALLISCAGLGFLYISANSGIAPASPHSPEELRVLFTSSVLLVSAAVAFVSIFYENLVQSALNRWRQTAQQLLAEKESHKKQAEETLQIKERYELALASADIGLWEYDIKTETLSWSDLVHEILGTKDQIHELSGDFVEERLHPEDAKAVRAAMERSAVEDKPFSITFRMKKACGGYAHIRSRGGLVRNAENDAVGLAGSFMDVSEEQWSETCRQEVWGILTNPQLSTQIKINAALSTLTNYFNLDFGLVSRIAENDYFVEYAVTPSNEINPGDRFDFDSTYCAHVFKADGPCSFHHAGKSRIKDHPCYRSFGLEAYIGAPLFVDGRRYGTLNFSSPTPRTRPFSKFELHLVELVAQWIGYEVGREKALRKITESEEKFALAVKGSSVGIWDWVDINSKSEVWSDQFYKLLGYQPGEINACLEQFQSLLHPDDHAATFEAVNRHFDEQEPFNVEYRLKCKDGNYRWFLGTGHAVWDEKGRPRRMIGSIMDIHERKAAETMKNEFVSTVSHELRTPMTSIIGAIELVRSQTFGELPPKALELLEIATSNGGRLVRLINDILEIEKIEAGKIQFETEILGVADFVEAAVKQNEGYVHANNATINLRNDIGDARICADPDRLTQVFTNLIGNAAKFTDDNGKIDLIVQADDDVVSISVKDNGPGIPPEKLDDIFDRFTQLDGADNRSQPGTGLGLAISKAIIDAHDGVLDVESKLGVGTVFTVILKRSNSVCKSIEPEKFFSEESMQIGDIKRVLQVEDDNDSAALLSSLLENIAEVTTVKTTAAARTRLNAEKFDLVILDMNLPDQKGDVVIEHIDKLEEKIPLIIYSVEDFSNKKQPDFVIGVFLKSKIQNEALRERLARALYGTPNGTVSQYG